jgi:hypothetical protein
MTLPEQLASKSGSIVETLKQTDYQHNEKIYVDTGVYDCNCNGLVGFVLETAAAAN